MSEFNGAAKGDRGKIKKSIGAYALWLESHEKYMDKVKLRAIKKAMSFSWLAKKWYTSSDDESYYYMFINRYSDSIVTNLHWVYQEGGVIDTGEYLYISHWVYSRDYSIFTDIVDLYSAGGDIYLSPAQSRFVNEFGRA